MCLNLKFISVKTEPTLQAALLSFTDAVRLERQDQLDISTVEEESMRMFGRCS